MALRPRLFAPAGPAPTDLVACVPQSEISLDLSRDQLALVAEAIRAAVDVDLDMYASELPSAEDRIYLTRWPGEHYRFIHALTGLLKPALAVDIGTYHGASALSMADHAGRVISYDIVALADMTDADPALFTRHPVIEQRTGDLADSGFFTAQRPDLATAEFVLVDGPKDGRFEYAVVPRLLETMRPGSVLVLDDIRFANMQPLWRSVDRPRLDVGSFAHSSGTGVVFC